METRNTRAITYILAGVQILVAVGTAILLPLVFFQSTAASREFDTSAQVIISILAAMMVLLAPVPVLLGQSLSELRVTAARLAAERQRSARVELVTGDLLRIQSAMTHVRTIDSGDLLFTLLGLEIGDLAERVDECARRRSLDCRPSYRMTDPLLDGLEVGSDLHFFHYADNHDWVLDIGGHSLDFQEKVAQRIETGKLQSVRRIIVVGTEAEASDVRTWVYCLFHRGARGFDYRVVTRPTFDRKRGETGVRLPRVDVGVYGHSYLFVSLQSPAAEDDVDRIAPHGILSTDSIEIGLYERLFREAWDAGQELSTPVLDALAEHLRASKALGLGADGAKLDSLARLEMALEHGLPSMTDVITNASEGVRAEFWAFVRRFPSAAQA